MAIFRRRKPDGPLEPESAPYPHARTITAAAMPVQGPGVTRLQKARTGGKQSTGAQDWQRSQRRHEHDELADSVPLTDESPAEYQIYLMQLFAELEDLGEGMKETALLVHAEGMSHAEAGAVLGVSESTISWRIHTIRRRMGTREARVSENV